jgi:hypothetical protein
LSWWKILSAAALLGLQDRLPYEGTLTAATLIPRMDVTCLLRTWKIKGVLVCPWRGDRYACLWVENAYPCGILELVRQPFRSHLAEFPRLPGRIGSSGHREGNLQFAEGRVLTFVPPLVQNLEIPIAAPRSQYRLNYVSELDAFGWRTGLLDLLFARPGDGVGNWGCAVPRSGFVLQQSEVLAAHLQAIRAGRVAARPWGRVVIYPYAYEPRLGHFVQMAAPVVKACVSIGHPDLAALERGSGSRHGAYLFIHWGLFEACRRCLPVRFLPPRPPK